MYYPKVSVCWEIVDQFPNLQNRNTLAYKLSIGRIKNSIKRMGNVTVLPYHPSSYESARLYETGEVIANLITDIPEARFAVGHPFIQSVEYHLGLDITQRIDLIQNNVHMLYNLYRIEEIKGLWLTPTEVESLIENGAESVLQNVHNTSYFNNYTTLRLNTHKDEMFLVPQNSRRPRSNEFQLSKIQNKNNFISIEEEGIKICEVPDRHGTPGANGFMEMYPYLFPAYADNMVIVSFSMISERINTEILRNAVVKRKRNPVRYLSSLTADGNFWRTVLVQNEDYTPKKVQVHLPGYWTYSEARTARVVFLPSIFLER